MSTTACIAACTTLSFTHTHTHTLSLAQTHSLTHTLSHTHSLTRILSHTQAEQEEVNEWIYPHINNGVYRCGFAQSQTAYEEVFSLSHTHKHTLSLSLSHSLSLSRALFRALSLSLDVAGPCEIRFATLARRFLIPKHYSCVLPSNWFER